jgi:hypothetical protein
MSRVGGQWMMTFVDDPWGEADPPAVRSVPPLPSRLARLAEVKATRAPIVDVDAAEWGFPRAAELPEVRASAADGWRPLHDAPLYCLLPARPLTWTATSICSARSSCRP